MKSTLSIFIFLLAIVGCSSKGDTLKPAKLLEFDRSVETSIRWKINTDLTRESTAESFIPLIEKQSLYVSGAEGKVKHFNSESGQLLWETDLKESLVSGVSGDNQRVYVNSQEGYLFALSKESGTIIWKKKFSSESFAAPAAANGMVILRSNNGDIIGLKAIDGEEVWRRQYNVPILTVHGYSTPLVVPGGVLLGLDDGSLLALTLEEGKVIWKTQVSRPQGRSEIERLVDVDGPIAIDDQFIYAVSFQGKIIQVEPQKGSVVWSRDMTSTSGVSVDLDMVYASEPDGYIWALDKRTGSSMWKMEDLEGRGLTRPVPFTDFLLVGDAEGYLHFLSRNDGSTVGRIRVDNSSIVAPPIVHNGVIFVQSSDGVIRAMEVAPIVQGT